jgi:hypothetical protein
MKKLLLTTTLTVFLSSASAQATNCDGNCDSNNPSEVPEPATIGLMGAGVAAIGFASWRKNRKK